MDTDEDIVHDVIERLDKGESDGTLDLDKLSNFQLIRVVQILVERDES